MFSPSHMATSRRAHTETERILRRATEVLEQATPSHNRVGVERIDKQPLRSPYVDLVLTANSPSYRDAIVRGFSALRDGLFTVEAPRTEPLADADGVSVRNQETIVIRAWRKPPGLPCAYSARIVVVFLLLVTCVAVYAYSMYILASKVADPGRGATESNGDGASVDYTPYKTTRAPPRYPADDDDDQLYSRFFD